MCKYLQSLKNYKNSLYSRNKMFKIFKAWYFQNEDAGHWNELSYSKNWLKNLDFFQKASNSDLELGQFNGSESLLQSISALMSVCLLEKIGVFPWNYHCLFSELLCNFVMACCLFFGMNSHNSPVSVKTIATSILKKMSLCGHWIWVTSFYCFEWVKKRNWHWVFD